MSTWQPTFTIPTVKATDVLNTITDYWGYQVEVTDPKTIGGMMPNPQSRKDFAYDKMLNYIRESYKAGKVNANQSTVQTVRDDADSVDITVA